MKILTLCTAILGMGLFTSSVEAKPHKINGIAAKVNGTGVVTDSEVAFMLAPRRAELAARHPRRGPKYYSALKQARKKILEELIDRQLIILEFKAMGAQIPEHVIDSEIKRQIETLYNGSEAKFNAELKRSGLSRKKFRKLTKDKLIGQAMRAQHFNDAAPATPAEIRAEYRKHKSELRDHSKDRIDIEKIYIPKANPDDLLATPESQLEFAEDLIKQIKAGKNFAELAKEYSKDAFAAKGGKQLNLLRSDLSPAIGTILFSEDEGTIIGPLEDTKGYHIIRIIRKIPGPAVPLSKVKDQIERIVQNRKSSTRFKRYMARLRKKAIIKYYK